MNGTQTVIKNFEVFKAQAEKLGTKAGTLIEWLDRNAERVMLAPASTRREYTCCHPGGLVEHSLRVLKIAAQLRQAYGQVENVTRENLILVSLFHDIGKVGTESKEYYVDNTSDWHRDKLGILYNVADRFAHLPASQLSLHTLSQQKVEIDIDEWYSISMVGNKSLREDAPTSGTEPWLNVILSQAVKSACLLGKNKTAAVIIQ
jgi:hypothetical protein